MATTTSDSECANGASSTPVLPLFARLPAPPRGSGSKFRESWSSSQTSQIGRNPFRRLSRARLPDAAHGCVPCPSRPSPLQECFVCRSRGEAPGSLHLQCGFRDSRCVSIRQGILPTEPRAAQHSRVATGMFHEPDCESNRGPTWPAGSPLSGNHAIPSREAFAHAVEPQQSWPPHPTGIGRLFRVQGEPGRPPLLLYRLGRLHLQPLEGVRVAILGNQPAQPALPRPPADSPKPDAHAGWHEV